MAGGKWAEFDAKRVTERRSRDDSREKKAYEQAKAKGLKTYSYGVEGYGGRDGYTVTKKLSEYGLPDADIGGSVDYTQMSDDQFNNYLSNRRLSFSRQQQLNEANGLGSTARTSQFGDSKTNTDYGGDWTQGNSAFSFDTLKSQAKDLAQQNLENSRNLMDLSYGYRTKEKNLDSEIRSREANQQFGFQQALEGIKNTQQSKYQADQFNQDNNMFERNKQMQNENMASARSAANSLYFGGFSKWGSGRR